MQAYRAKDACIHAADQGHPVVVSPMGAYYLRGDGATWQETWGYEPFVQCEAAGNATRQGLILVRVLLLVTLLVIS